MTNSSTTIVVVDGGDRSGLEIINRLIEMSNRRLVSELFIVVVEERDGSPLQRAARHVGPGRIESCDLFDRLSTGRETSHVRVVGVSATSSESEAGELRVARLVHDIKSRLVHLMGVRLAVADVRVGIRGFGEQIPASGFYSTDASCNLLLIPQDRRSDLSIARPIERGEGIGSKVFLFHGASELIGLLGLWIGMSAAPIDRFQPQVAGVDVPFVRFVQSRTRVMLAPPLPMSEIADPQASLPLPSRHLAATRSAGAADDLAERIFPDYLRFVPDDAPDGTTKVAGGVRALMRFMGEFLRSTLLLPRIIMRGVRHEFDRAAADIHQEFVGSDARLRILGAEGGEDAAVDIAADIEELLVSAESEELDDILSPVDRTSWTALVSGVFGIVDGSTEFAELRRESFGNDIVVAVDRNILGDIGDGPLPDVIAQLGGVVAQPAARTVDVVVAAAAPVSEPSGSTEAADDEGQSWPIESGTLPWVDEEGAPFNGMGEAHDAGGGMTDVADVPTDMEAPRRDPRLGSSLPRAVTAQFEAGIAGARSYLHETVAAIREQITRLRGRPEESVSPVVAVAAWVALLLMLFVLATCTPVRDRLDVIPQGVARDAAWTGISSVFVVGALLLLGIGGGRRTWQIRALLTAASVGIFLSLVLLSFGELRDLVREESHSWAAIAVAVATLLLVVVAVVRSVASRSRARRELGRLLGLAGSLYLWVGAVFQQVSSGSLLEENEGLRRNVLIVGALVPGSILVGCMAVVATTRMRQKYVLRDGKAKLDWLRGELDAAIDASMRLELARRQWLATAASLARFLSYPLGRAPEHRREISLVGATEETVLKFDVARLDLSQRGRDGLLARLRRHFVEVGWLGRQYEKAVRAHAADRAHAQGLMPDEVEDHRPEWDPETADLEALMAGRPGTDRLNFAIALYEGRFDKYLSEVPQGLSLDGVYQSILDDIDSYTVVGSQSGRVSARGFLEQVVPTAELDLPTGLVTKAFIADDPQRRLSSDLWWPARLVGQLEGTTASCRIHEAECDVDRIGREETVLVGVRVDISEPFAYFDCVGAREVEVFEVPEQTDSGDGF